MLFAIFALTGCQDKQVLDELDELKNEERLEEQNVEVVRNFIEAWNNGDFQTMNELLDPQMKLYVPSISESPMTGDQYDAWIKTLYQSFTDIRYDIRDIFASGNSVAVWWVFTAIHSADFQGIPATGNSITASAIEIYTVQDGKIVSERAETDALGMYQQLGLSLQ